MKQKILTIAIIFLIALSSGAQLSVSANKRFLITKDGKPFFWLGDTAWELFHRLSREEADKYLKTGLKKDSPLYRLSP